MSKVRKRNNTMARVERNCRALVRTNHVCVVNIDPSGRQGMMNWKSLKNIQPGAIGQAVCCIAHEWTIYMSAMCIGPSGEEYLKSIEISPDGMYLSDHLEDAIENFYLELRNSANQKHMVASGWIAIPDKVSLTEEQAAKVFAAAGAWNQVKVA